MVRKYKSVASTEKVSREIALEQIYSLREKYGEGAISLHSANEAKTRLLIIDTVLESLGWSRDDFNPEHHAGSAGFIDYLMSTENMPRFIVEAKRVEHTFSSPRTGMKRTEYPLSYVRSAFGSSVSEVIDQATRYSIQTSIPYAVITNGCEWMLMQTIPYNHKSIEDLQCFYFGSIFSEKFNFELLWQLLAKQNVLDGSLESQFSQLNAFPTDFCGVPSQKLPEIHWTKGVGAEEKYLRDFYQYFFDEIIDEGRRKMLEYCFVSNTRLDQYQGELKRVLRDTAPSYIPDAIEITPEEHQQLLVSSSGDRKGRVILVTGSVGCGKSTLVNKVLVGARRNNNLFCLTVDLINEISGEISKFNEQLWKELFRKWRQENPESFNYETKLKIFGRELKDFKDEFNPKLLANEEFWLQKENEKLQEWSNSLEYFIERSWRYYARNRGKGIIVFIDNIDRAVEEYQELVYAFAHKIADLTGATVIITMREVTYFRGQESGFLDVRSGETVFHLQTPDLVQILSKRIEYVERLNESDDHRLKEWRRRDDWDKFYESTLKYIEALKSTFLTSSESQRSVELLGAISWHNVRYFLDSLRKLHVMLGNEPNTWSVSEIIAALMIPNSRLGNQFSLASLFQPPDIQYSCYFLKIRVLLMLLHGKHSSKERQGISLREIFTFTRRYKYQDRWTRFALQDMVQQRLLECVQVPSATEYTKEYKIQENHSFRASPLSVALLEQIQFDKAYISMLGNDLPFHNSIIFNRFIQATEEVVSILSSETLDRHGVELLIETDAGRIVVEYLVNTLQEEAPIGKAAMYIPEVTVTEQRLEDVVKKLLSVTGISSSPESGISNPTEATLFSQLPLFQVPPFESPSQNDDSVYIPNTLKANTSSRERLTPLIFWALVKLRARGTRLATGAEVTRTISCYLTDDHTKVEPTNISRKLRSKVMRTEPWLVADEVTFSGKKRYGVASDWKQYWQAFFNELPPEID